MRRTVILSIFIFHLINSLVFGVVWGNGNPILPDPHSNPNGDPGGRSAKRELGHEKFVRLGCSKLLSASSLVNEFCAKYELGEVDLELLVKAEPLFDEAAGYFDVASRAVASCVPSYVKDMFLKYKYYEQFVFMPGYDGHIMLDVCSYLKKGNFQGFHGRCAQIIREMKQAVLKLRFDATSENVMNAYKSIRNPFGHYGTIVCAKVASAN